MKRTSLLFVCLFAGTVASDAAVVFADDFSYTNGTTLHGQNPDVGSGTWNGGSGWQANDGAVALVGSSDTTFGTFTETLSAGKTLTITFNTLEITGFLGNNWAGVALFNGGNEAFMFGDTGGPNTDWRVYPLNVSTGDTNQVNTATFSYVYDTGAWTFHLAASGYSTNGTATKEFALNRVRLAGGGVTEGGNMKLDGITVTIVPEPGSAVLAAMGMLTLCFRRRSRS